MAFGNALGNSIVNRLSSPSQLEQESASGDTGGQAGRQGQGASGASKTTSAAQTNSHKAANQAIANEGAQPASALDGIDASILDDSEFDSIVADDSIPWDVRSKLVAQRGGRLEASGVEVYPVAPIADYPIEYLDLGEPSIVSTPSTGERSLWEQTKTFGEGLFELGVVSVNNSVVGLGGGLTFLGTWALTGDLDNALGFREYFTDQYGARLTTEGGQAMGKWIGDKLSWVDDSRNTAGDWALERFGPAAATAAYMWPEVVEIAVGGATRGARGLEFVEVQHTPGFKGQTGGVGWVQRATGNKNTGTVWDSVQRVDAYDNYPGTDLPRAYITEIEGKKLFVAPNATKHIHEELTKTISSPNVDVGGKVPVWQSKGSIQGENFTYLPDRVRTQEALTSFHSGIANVIRNNKVQFNKIYVSDTGWEIILAPPRSAGELPAIKHARLLNQSN